MEGQVPGRVAWNVLDLKRPNLVAFTQCSVDRARHVLRASERETDRIG